MTTSAPPLLTIIGPGRVGKTLGRVMHAAAAARLGDIVGSTEEKAADAVHFIGAGTARTGLDGLQPSTIYLLAVPDDRIETVCIRLSAAHELAGSVVFHCSGALTGGALHAARTAGATVASIHPVRSFADPETVAGRFAGTCCGIEGDAVALAVLQPLFAQCGAQWIPIDSTHKTLYHAAAVFSSNYLVTLIDVAVQVSRDAEGRVVVYEPAAVVGAHVG